MDFSKLDETYRKQTLMIVYESKAGVITKRMVHILVVEDNYIIAFCYLRRKMRKFLKRKILAWEKIQQQEEILL